MEAPEHENVPEEDGNDSNEVNGNLDKEDKDSIRIPNITDEEEAAAALEANAAGNFTPSANQTRSESRTNFPDDETIPDGPVENDKAWNCNNHLEFGGRPIPGFDFWKNISRLPVSYRKEQGLRRWRVEKDLAHHSGTCIHWKHVGSSCIRVNNPAEQQKSVVWMRGMERDGGISMRQRVVVRQNDLNNRFPQERHFSKFKFHRHEVGERRNQQMKPVKEEDNEYKEVGTRNPFMQADMVLGMAKLREERVKDALGGDVKGKK
ncbi:hypothetical protein B0H11DRAFT_1906133 [Mycena galericulata]|nr:hypothetical protein B0H11DRAFT_1906133 [Mycena galericulata]